MIGRGPADATARAVGLELSARRPGVEHLADLDTEGDELVARSLRCRRRSGRGPGPSRARPSVMFVPNWTEHPEPGGVNWTTRKPLSKGKSASSLHPRFP